MPAIVNETITVVVSALMGVVTGIWMRGGLGARRGAEHSDRVDGRVETDPVAWDGKTEQLLEKVDQFLSRLQDLTTDMASGVHGHVTIIQQTNDELRKSVAGTVGPRVFEAVTKLAEANESLRRQLEAAERRLENQATQLKSHVADARMDDLTGLANRLAFEEDVRECLAETVGRDQPSSLMLLDIDRFDALNERFGREAGNEALRRVAGLLRDNLSEREKVYRYGDDEFAVLFVGSGLKTARVAAERARDSVGDATLPLGEHNVLVTVSAGLATMENEDKVRDVLRRADLALFASKEAGRDRGHWHDGHRIEALTEDVTDGILDQPPTAALDVPADDATRSEDRPPATPVEAVGEREPSAPDSRSFAADVARRLAAWRRGGEPLALMFVKIDNASQSPPGVVDAVTEELMALLRAQLREMDHVARYRRTVIGVILPSVELDGAIIVAERVRRCVQQHRFHAVGESGAAGLSVSIGIVESTKRQQDSDSLIGQVERTVHEAERRGGDRTVVHDGEQLEQVFVMEERPELDGELQTKA